jgi:hypothetical protein
MVVLTRTESTAAIRPIVRTDLEKDVRFIVVDSKRVSELRVGRTGFLISSTKRDADRMNLYLSQDLLE